MGRVSTGVDVGTSTVKLVRGEVKGTSFVLHELFVASNEEGTVESGWDALAGGPRPLGARVGLTGREVNVRYSRVPRLPDWQLRRLMRFEAEEVGGRSEARVASDFNLLPEIPEIEDEDVVLLCMARESLLERHLEGLRGARGRLDAFTPNAIGLYDAYLHYGVVLEDTVLVANVGRENLDVVLARGTDLLFARNLSGGSRLFDEAIAERFGIDPAAAERYKLRHGTLELSGPFEDANQEKAARAMAGAAGQIHSLLQSAVLFAKTQIRLSSLKLDRVLLCGGGAALPGLTDYLRKALGVPVELFDPWVVVDASRLDAEAAAVLEEHKLEAVCALGLATAASDPEAYSIEILPERVRRRREVLGGQAFLVAAAGLAALFLVLFAWRQHRELGELEERARALEGEFRRADARHRETALLLEENAELEDLALELFALKGAGEQLVRLFDVVERRMPQDFWLESLSLVPAWDEELGVARGDERPLVRLEGRVREGVESPAIHWEELTTALRAELPEARMKGRLGRSDFTLDFTMLAPPAAGADADEGGEQEEPR